MQVIICDDESVYLDSIHQFIDQWAKRTLHTERIFVKEYHSSEDLLEYWENGMTIDLLFMDIQIPGEMSGMEVARQIHGQDEYIPIIFITNYSEYALEGYSVNALRYLKKPVSQKDIETCMDIVWRQWANGHDQFLTVTTNTQSIHVPIQAIIFAESISHILRISTSDELGIYEIRGTLERLEGKLPSEGFIRCHKSYIVSLRHVRRYKSGIITLSTGKEIPVGRKYVKSFSQKFRMFYQGSEC